MKIERLPDLYAKSVLAAISESAQSMQDERSSGLHMSTIIRSIMESLEPKRFKGRSDDGPPVEWTSAGIVWEYLLETAMVKLAAVDGMIRPGEVEKDGIACTPDGITVSDWTVHEFKFTWMSSHEAIEHRKFHHWIIQVKAYCHVLGSNRARVHGFFVMGDYRGSGPQTLAWDLEFSTLELSDNWAMLTNQAKHKGWLK